MKKLLALLLAAVMLLGVLVGCDNTGSETKPSDEASQGGSAEATQGADAVTTEPAADAPKYGGHLDICVQSMPTGLDPLKQTGTWRYIWTTCVWENPLTRDADNNIAPGVCDYELSEDSLTLKLWVRDGITFHNGDVVDIEDVLASINRACDMHSTRQKRIRALAESMTIEGDILTIKFSEHDERTLVNLAAWQPWIAVMPKEICEKYASEPLTCDDVADAIGTGPYKIKECKENLYVVVEKYADYQTIESDRTGYAGPKYGYMDSITFHCNQDYSNSAMAVLTGTYDMNDDIAGEYADLMKEAGIVCELYDCNLGLTITFNTTGDSPVARYPDLRKAIMAAIDYTDFLDMQANGVYDLTGNLILGETYATDIFDKADYAGEQDLELSKKYQEAAKAAGWDPENDPVILVLGATADIQATMFSNFLRDAGIAYELQVMENTASSKILNDPTSYWSFKFSWPTLSYTPTTITSALITTNYASEQKDAILAEMSGMKIGSDEYIAKWHELAQQMVDDCATVNLGILKWRWYHPETLNTDDEGPVRFVYN